MGCLLPDAGQAESQAAAPVQLSKASWLSCSNLILNLSPKATGDEDQKHPMSVPRFLCTGGVALGCILLVPVHSAASPD